MLCPSLETGTPVLTLPEWPQWWLSALGRSSPPLRTRLNSHTRMCHGQERQHTLTEQNVTRAHQQTVPCRYTFTLCTR